MGAALFEWRDFMNNTEKYVPKTYERVSGTYEQGDILHNLNGNDYRVMERYTPDCLLLMNVNTGNFMVATGVASYRRYPEGEEPTKENVEEGIEWGSGLYLSATPSEIDFEGLRTQYSVLPKMTKDTEYQVEIREILSRVETIKADSIAEAIDMAMEMYQKEEIVLDSKDYKGVDYLPVEKSR